MIIEMTKQQICNELGITKNNLRVIEQRGQLYDRLINKGYKLIEKEKVGRNVIYKIETCEAVIPEKEKNFNVEKELWRSIGIYKIELENEIYIGSTVRNFRDRYLSHLSRPANEDVGRILNNGAVFSIIQICDGMDEDDIRRIEDNYIEEYKNNQNYIVLNKTQAWNSFNIKEKKHSIHLYNLSEEEYNKITKFLKENNILTNKL